MDTYRYIVSMWPDEYGRDGIIIATHTTVEDLHTDTKITTYITPTQKGLFVKVDNVPSPTENAIHILVPWEDITQASLTKPTDTKPDESSSETETVQQYPTNKQIVNAQNTILALLAQISQSEQPYDVLTTNALNSAMVVLTNLSYIPGLQNPPLPTFPKPSPLSPEKLPNTTSAFSVLQNAWSKTNNQSPEHGILWTVLCYTQQHPAWFNDVNWQTPAEALLVASQRAVSKPGVVTEGVIASQTLHVASAIAHHNPYLFSDAERP